MNTHVNIEVRRGARIIEERKIGVGEKLLIGRGSDVDVHLSGQDISRHHARVQVTENGLLIDDLSLNGVTAQTIDGHVEFDSPVQVGSYSLTGRCIGNKAADIGSTDFRKSILLSLIDNLNLNALERSERELRPRVESVLDRILFERGVLDTEQRKRLVDELSDEALGLGPLERMLHDDEISEIMVVNPSTIYVEKNGVLEKTEYGFSSEDSARTIIERIVTPLGRRIDEASPMVDARLQDGSRVNAVIPPLALNGPCITIRKFSRTALTMDDLVHFGTLSKEMAVFLMDAVRTKMNIVISGGTGSGKTTLLNVLSGAIPNNERVVTIEDAAELQLEQPHVVRLESRPANAEGRGKIGIRELVQNSLRMRPDRIVVGECRGGEALDMLQAMNTGHDGSLTTTHANSPAEAIGRLETLCLMAGIDLPSRAIREQIAGAVDIIVQQNRFSDGGRKIVSIAEVTGMEDERVTMNEIFAHHGSGDSSEKGECPFQATGWIPKFKRIQKDV